MKITVANEPYSEDTTKECAIGNRREVVGGTLRRKVENTWGKIRVHGRT